MVVPGAIPAPEIVVPEVTIPVCTLAMIRVVEETWVEAELKKKTVLSTTGRVSAALVVTVVNDWVAVCPLRPRVTVPSEDFQLNTLYVPEMVPAVAPKVVVVVVDGVPPTRVTASGFTRENAT